MLLSIFLEIAKNYLRSRECKSKIYQNLYLHHNSPLTGLFDLLILTKSVMLLKSWGH